MQDALLDCADEVWELLQHGAAVFRLRQRRHDGAGRAQRAHDDLPRQDRRGEADAAAWLAGLRSTDRYLEDIWGG